MAIIKNKESGKIQNVVKTMFKVNGKWATVTSVKTKADGSWK